MRAKVNTYPLHTGKIAPVTFAQRMKSLVKPGKSERQVAGELGISHTQFARYATGKAQPTLPTLEKIADALEVSLDELAGRAPDRPRKPLVVSVDGEFYVPVSAARAAQIAVDPGAVPASPVGDAPDQSGPGDVPGAVSEEAGRRGRGSTGRSRQRS